MREIPFITALLPMKGHSERVPNKNMRAFAGVPLYHAVARELQRSKYITRIVINTDSDRIANDARAHFSKVSIVDRPEHIQGDFVPMNEIIEYDLSQTDGEFYLQTHSTNPLLRAETIDAAIEFYVNNQKAYDSLFSVTRIQSRFYWQDGSAINHNPRELLRTQDLPPIFEENSCFYLFSKTSFKAAGSRRIGLKPFMYAIDKLEAVDIDEPQDFILAEALFKTLRQEVP
jgi:N-acylneuraminate cytidylyltransferase